MEDNEGRFLRNFSVSPEALTPVWILSGRYFGDWSGGDLHAAGQYHPVNTKGMLCPEATKSGTIGRKPGGGSPYSYDIEVGDRTRAWALELITKSEGHPDEVFVCSASYGFNGWLFQRQSGRPTLSDRSEALRGPQAPSYTNIFLMRWPAGVPLLLDCAKPSGSPTDDEPPSSEYIRFRDPEVILWGGGFGGFCMDRHTGHINGLFLDWSVRKVGLKELWTLKWYETFNTANKWTKAGGVRPTDWPPWLRDFKDY